VETAIWIAVISAFGVIGSAFIQWRSNRATVQAAERREVAEREDKNKQLTEEREHQRLMAADADARALALKQWEAQLALNETWRPKRVQAHQAALRAIDPYIEAIRNERFTFYMSRVQKVPLKSSGVSLEALRNAVESTTADVDTFGSETSSARLQELILRFRGVQAGFNFKLLISTDRPVTEEELAALDSQIADVERAIGEYRKAAKADIGTVA
jgi:hypothetical protein